MCNKSHDKKLWERYNLVQWPFDIFLPAVKFRQKLPRLPRHLPSARQESRLLSLLRSLLWVFIVLCVCFAFPGYSWHFFICCQEFIYLRMFAGIVYAHLFCACNACHLHHTWVVFLQHSITNNRWHTKRQFFLVKAYKTMRNTSISNTLWDI